MKGTIWRAALTIFTMAPLAAASASGQPDPVAEMTARAQNTMLLAVDAEIELLEALVAESRLGAENAEEAYRDRRDTRAPQEKQADIDEAYEILATIEATLTAVRFYRARFAEYEGRSSKALWNASVVARRRAEYLRQTVLLFGATEADALNRIDAALNDPWFPAIGGLIRWAKRREERSVNREIESTIRQRERGLYTEATTPYEMASMTALAYDAAVDALDIAARELAAQGPE